MRNERYYLFLKATCTLLLLLFFACRASTQKFISIEMPADEFQSLKKTKIAVEVSHDEQKNFWKKKPLRSILKDEMEKALSRSGLTVVSKEKKEKYDLLIKSYLVFQTSGSTSELMSHSSKQVIVKTIIFTSDGLPLYQSGNLKLYRTTFFMILFFPGGQFFSLPNYRQSAKNYSSYQVSLLPGLSRVMQKIAGHSRQERKQSTGNFRYTVSLKTGKKHENVTFAIADDSIVVADRFGNVNIYNKNQISGIKRQ